MFFNILLHIYMFKVFKNILFSIVKVFSRQFWLISYIWAVWD